MYETFIRVVAVSNTSTVTLPVVGAHEKGSLESETVKYGASYTGLGPENDYAGEDQQQLKTTDPSARQRGCYIRTITTNVQFENKITVSWVSRGLSPRRPDWP
jgi:hypothetical protein